MIFLCWLLILQVSAQVWHSLLSPNFVALTYESILLFPNASFILPIKIYTPRKQGLYVLFTTVIHCARHSAELRRPGYCFQEDAY